MHGAFWWTCQRLFHQDLSCLPCGILFFIQHGWNACPACPVRKNDCIGVGKDDRIGAKPISSGSSFPRMSYCRSLICRNRYHLQASYRSQYHSKQPHDQQHLLHFIIVLSLELIEINTCGKIGNIPLCYSQWTREWDLIANFVSFHLALLAVTQ